MVELRNKWIKIENRQYGFRSNNALEISNYQYRSKKKKGYRYKTSQELDYEIYTGRLVIDRGLWGRCNGKKYVEILFKQITRSEGYIGLHPLHEKELQTYSFRTYSKWRMFIASCFLRYFVPKSYQENELKWDKRREILIIPVTLKKNTEILSKRDVSWKKGDIK